MEAYMPVSSKYAVEAVYLGEDAPWKGWKVIRTYPSLDARDADLARLTGKDKSSLWDYRVKIKGR